MKGPRRDTYEKVKIHYPSLKNISRTIGPISTKLGKNYPWMRGTQGVTDKDNIKRFITKYEKGDDGFFPSKIKVMIKS